MEEQKLPKQQIDLLPTFAENSLRLQQKYLSNKILEQKKDLPKEQWNFGEWMKWAINNVDQEQHFAIREELEGMFHYKQKNQTIYEKRQFDTKLFEELSSYKQEASRYTPNDNPVLCIIYSLYTEFLRDYNIPDQKIEPALWQVGTWKDRSTKIQMNKTISNFTVTTQTKVIIPTLEINHKDNLNPNKKKLLVPNQPLTDDEKKAQYIYLEYYINQTMLFWGTNTVSSQQYTDSFRWMSDDDIANFVYFTTKAKSDYPDPPVNRQPTNLNDSVLPDFDDKQIVAIVGDWGTGIRDSFDLVDELVLKRGATIILHLGDVYYAGYPAQFSRVSYYIQKLREKANKNIRYYAIPGNHDYYTNGGPFYDHLNDCNSQAQLKQKFGFFCLRNKSKTVQYLGLDTGRTGSALFDEISPTFKGTYIQEKELAWAKDKIINFPGKTILLTHHQVFSPFDKIIGVTTSFGYNNQQFNNLLSQQFFDVMNKITLWFWGHEHRLAGFIDNAYGIPKARMVGNSAFQVHHQDTYKVNYPKFNVLKNNFVPGKDQQNDYFNHTGTIIRPNGDGFTLDYINMTSSYTKPAELRSNFSETVFQPAKQIVRTRQPYKILDWSGLSYALSSDYIWLDYGPTDVIFESTTNPVQEMDITPQIQFTIRTADNKYFYLSSFNYMYVTTDKNKAHTFKFVLPQGKTEVALGESMKLFNINKNLQIGRYYYVTYYAVAASGSTEIAPIKVYRTGSA